MNATRLLMPTTLLLGLWGGGIWHGAQAQTLLPRESSATVVMSSTTSVGTQTKPEVTPQTAPARRDLDAAKVKALKPGQFLWQPELQKSGPMVIVVSLPEQRAHVYRGGVRIGVATVSTGMPGRETPTGTYPILQKKKINYSNLYNNAPMPWMQRLTWDGIALHSGQNPGRPASHGCVRLPHKFAEALYTQTTLDMLVIIADETSHDLAVVHPGERAPVDAMTGLVLPITVANADVVAQQPASASRTAHSPVPPVMTDLNR